MKLFIPIYVPSVEKNIKKDMEIPMAILHQLAKIVGIKQ